MAGFPVSSSSAGTALITGAARGLGAGIARRLGNDGWSVLLVDRSDKVHETTLELARELELPEGRLISCLADVSKEDQIEDAVAEATTRFGSLELAVANAGIGGVEVDLIDLEPSDFDDIIAVNLRGTYLTCRAAGRVMRKANRGSIITISSIFGWEPYPRVAAYSATKAGIMALTQALSLELAPYGVRVNSIAPGYMATEMQWVALRARAAHAGISFEEERQRVWDKVPLGRHGTLDEVGAAVAFLASSDAAYITGHTLGVTGGVVRR
jgi:NAD(P)-dependent dehydrogenase (short-subunit alcohol dehydrogenase family)